MPDAAPARDVIALGLIAALSVVVVVAVGLLYVAPAVPAGGRDVSALPLVDAVLNGLSATLLVAGYAFIRHRRVAAHRACMLAALGVSTLFLVSYVTYHLHAGPTRFAGHGAVRAIYFCLLITHVLLAATIAPLALTTAYRALAGRFDRHVPLARLTLPIWLYVSVTGVAVYWMLHHLR